jgi:ABC-type glutathione transport system ATPase component
MAPGGLQAPCKSTCFRGRGTHRSLHCVARIARFAHVRVGAIKFEHVTKIYPDGTQAVTDSDLLVPDGSLANLVGPSGCGKTTLLRMAAGLEDITEGQIAIGGEVVNDLSPKQRDIAMIVQNYALYPHMTVYYDMAFGLQLRREKKAEIDRRVREAASTLGLTEYLGKEAEVSVRRATLAGCDGPGDRAEAAGVPDGRAAVEPPTRSLPATRAGRSCSGSDPAR